MFQPAITAKSCSLCCAFEPSGFFIVSARASEPSRSFCPLVVGQPASHTTRPRSELSGTFTSGLPPSFQSLVVVVGQPVKPLADVEASEAFLPEARSAGIDCPAGVTRFFQVSLYKVQPAEAVLARNLLPKDCWRT